MADRYRLSNGFTVVFEPQRTAHVAAFQVWVKAGSADERPDQAGLAHLHEHMLFKGTARRGPGEVAREIEASGGEINAWTSFDQTVYHVVMASPFARNGLDVLGDAVRHPAFDAEELAREIEVVREEIKRSLDQPARRASRALYSTTFCVHPYGLPVIGTDESVRSFTREKVLEFYRAHYTPQNMVLAAVGDLDRDALLKWAEEIFGGDWGRTYAGRVVRPVEPPIDGRRVRVVEDPAKEVYATLAFHCPPGLHPDSPALDALTTILGQGDASRLSLEVKRRKGLANGISAYAYTPVDTGMISATFTSTPQKAAAALEETLRVLVEATQSPVTAEELATAKALIESEAVYGKETVQGQARKLGFYEASGGGLEEEAKYYDAIARLTVEDLQAAAAKYLRLDRIVASLMVPTGAALTTADVERVLDRAGKDAAPRAPVVRSARAEAAPLRIAARARADSEVRVEKLASGATLVLRQEASAPLFAMRAAFLGGTRFETDETSGLTALLSRSWTRGTQARSAEELSLTMHEMAGGLGASTGRNSVNVRGEFLSKHFRRAFELFAEVLNAPTFADAEVERERRLQLHDLHTRDDRPSTVAFDLFSKTLFQHHPYRLRIHGEIPVVEKLQPAELRRYHARHLDPSQLTLAVVGDVDLDEVRALADAAFGKTRGEAAAPPAVGREPSYTARTTHHVLPTAQSHLVLGFPGLTLEDPDRWALEVLSTVLSGQGGRLFIELRDKRSMAYSVSAYNIEGIDPGYFAVYIGTSPEKVGAALTGIREELQRIRESRITPAELDRALRHLIGTHEISLQRNGARAGLLAVDHLFGLGLEKFAHYAERISRVTADDVLRVAQRLIDLDRMALAQVGPAAGA